MAGYLVVAKVPGKILSKREFLVKDVGHNAEKLARAHKRHIKEIFPRAEVTMTPLLNEEVQHDGTEA
jgi:hypothetical protein